MKEFDFYYVIDIYSKYTRVVPLKGKKSIATTNPFQKNVDEFGRKLNKIWVDKGKEFCNRSIKSWLKKQ